MNKVSKESLQHIREGKPTLSSSSSSFPVPLVACSLSHYCTPSLQSWVTPYTPENGKGCSCCPQRSCPCPCKKASYPQAQKPWPPSEPGRVEQLSVETLHLCKTPHFASNNWGQRPQRLSLWNTPHERGDSFYSGALPPAFAGPGWCCATAGWHRRAQWTLWKGTELEDKLNPKGKTSCWISCRSSGLSNCLDESIHVPWKCNSCQWTVKERVSSRRSHLRFVQIILLLNTSNKWF